jgi:hypothetical protein
MFLDRKSFMFCIVTEYFMAPHIFKHFPPQLVIYVHIYLRVVRAFWGGGLYQYFTSGARVPHHRLTDPSASHPDDLRRYTLCHVSPENERVLLPTWRSLILLLHHLSSGFLFFLRLKIVFRSKLVISLNWWWPFRAETCREYKECIIKYFVNCCERRYYLYFNITSNRMHNPIINIVISSQCVCL